MISAPVEWGFDVNGRAPVSAYRRSAPDSALRPEERVRESRSIDVVHAATDLDGGSFVSSIRMVARRASCIGHGQVA